MPRRSPPLTNPPSGTVAFLMVVPGATFYLVSELVHGQVEALQYGQLQSIYDFLPVAP